MSTTQRGTVASLHKKDWNGTMLYSFKLESSERFWRLGQKEPEFKVGDAVQFTERNSSVDWDSIKAIAKEDLVEMVPDKPTVDVGARIRYQAARADATRLVVAALHCDALPWTVVEFKKKGQRLDLLTGYIKQVTQTLLDQEEEV